MRLRVLIVEDLEDDAALVLRALRKGHFEIEHRRVDTAPAMAEALQRETWDLVISDHHMPCFSSGEALSLLKQHGQDLPFIIVSGQIGEDTAIAAMKAGAHDYIMKDKLGRLVPAVARELKEAAIRREHTQAQNRLAYLAHYDELTGLPNRILFSERLRAVCGQCTDTGPGAAVLLLGLDRFTSVNMNLGHEMGDRLLCAAAGRLGAGLRTTETLARLESDQFGILIPSIVDVAAIEQRARRLLDVFDQPFHLDAHELFITASIGITLLPDDGREVTALLRNVDLALHRAKERGRNRREFFTAQLRTTAAERLQLEGHLRRALARDGLLVYYQPKRACRDGRQTGMEALLRWRNGNGHDTGELMAPGEIIPVAEETGLIVPVGDWVLREACRQLRQWRAQGRVPGRMAVNLSVRQFERGNLVETVRQVLDENGLEPQHLELEITESLLLRNDPDNIAVLRALHAHGIHIALDDFGTGYSSLSYLQRFPIDTLKIDQSFVRGLPDDPDSAAIANAIISMAHSIDKQVVAEGVETAAQRDFLHNLGCDQLQGYYLGRPMPAEEMEQVWQATQ